MVKRCIKYYAIVTLAAFVYVLLFSLSTSPLYRFKVVGYDSYIFQTIGKYWNRQCIPYVGLFDHKGSLIFLINKAGYLLTGNKYGIFVIQIVCMSFVINIMFKMFRQAFSKNMTLIMTVISMTGFLICYASGNLTEEYILPFLMASYCQFWTWINEYITKHQVEHKPIDAFLYGTTFGVAVMTRINNAIGICVIVLFVTIILVKEKKWKNLILNMPAFGGGVLLILIPFCVYFALHHALYEMWFGTIAFNVSYVENSQGIFGTVTLKRAIQFLAIFFSGYSMMFAGIVTCMKSKRRYAGAFMIVLSVITTVMLAGGRLYEHYGMICLPYFVISIMELAKLEDVQMKNRIPRGMIVGFSVIFIIGGLNSIRARYHTWIQTQDLNNLDKIVSSIPDDDRDRFIAWSCPPYLYLKYDIKPCYKYFILQDSHAKVNEAVKNDIQGTFQTGGAEWILVKDGTQELIQDILESRYTLIEEQSDGSGNFLLYRENEY